MNAPQRREAILQKIRTADAPVSASRLAQEMGVSRQAIVGDVSLLRAQGHHIIATARGYIVPESGPPEAYIGTLACRHAPKDTRAELYTMVSLGAVVLNVIVSHDLYGEITGNLNFCTPQDIDAFIEKTAGAKLLSELTMGVHLHTVSCRDEAHFFQVQAALNAKGFLFRG